MKEITTTEIMKATALTAMDAARLVTELWEELGERVQGLGRQEVMVLLRRVMREGVEAVRASEQTVSFEQAAWESVAARSGRRPSTLRDLRHYVRRMLRVAGTGEMPLRRMRVADCRRILQAAFGQSASSYRKGRAVMHSIFAYGMRREWTAANPVSSIEVPDVQEKAIKPLSLEEVEKLMATAARPAHRDMLFSLHLMLYGGIRPTEVSRLREEDFCWEEKLVIIRPQKSKTGGGRAVPLRGLAAIPPGDRRIPGNWQNKWLALRRDAGFTHWVPDTCRHTFASYHAAYYRNLPELQLEMGHRDCTLLRSRYMVPRPRQQAARFWKGAGKMP